MPRYYSPKRSLIKQIVMQVRIAFFSEFILRLKFRFSFAERLRMEAENFVL